MTVIHISGLHIYHNDNDSHEYTYYISHRVFIIAVISITVIIIHTE